MVPVHYKCAANVEVRVGRAGVCFRSLVVTSSAGLDNRITHMSYACAVIYHTVFFTILLLSYLTAGVIPLTICSADGRVPYEFFAKTA